MGKSHLFISDAHLPTGQAESPGKNELKEFLGGISPDETEDLFVLGDLFDFWFEYRYVILHHHFDVLRLLSQLTERGIALHYVPGNHDFWLGEFMEKTIGFELHTSPCVVELDGLRVELCHGDGLNKKDVGYRLYQRVAKSRIARKAFSVIHPDVAARIAMMVSSTSRKLVNRHEHQRRSEVCAIEAYARQRLEAGDIDALLAGHAHTPVIEKVGGGGREKIYANTGDWLTHFSYVELRDGVFALKTFATESRSG